MSTIYEEREGGTEGWTELRKLFSNENISQEVNDLFEAIREAQKILIVAHTVPDLDSIASVAALFFLCRQKVFAKKGEPRKNISIFSKDDPVYRKFEHKEGYERLLKGVNFVTRLDAEYDLCIVADCGNWERTGIDLSFRKIARLTVNIDHHESVSEWGDLNFVDLNAASTTAVIYALFFCSPQERQVTLTPRLANLILLGLIGDTCDFSCGKVESAKEIERCVRYGLAERIIVNDEFFTRVDWIAELKHGYEQLFGLLKVTFEKMTFQNGVAYSFLQEKDWSPIIADTSHASEFFYAIKSRMRYGKYHHTLVYAVEYPEEISLSVISKKSAINAGRLCSLIGDVGGGNSGKGSTVVPRNQQFVEDQFADLMQSITGKISEMVEREQRIEALNAFSNDTQTRMLAMKDQFAVLMQVIAGKISEMTERVQSIKALYTCFIVCAYTEMVERAQSIEAPDAENAFSDDMQTRMLAMEDQFAVLMQVIASMISEMTERAQSIEVPDAENAFSDDMQNRMLAMIAKQLEYRHIEGVRIGFVFIPEKVWDNDELREAGISRDNIDALWYGTDSIVKNSCDILVSCIVLDNVLRFQILLPWKSKVEKSLAEEVAKGIANEIEGVKARSNDNKNVWHINLAVERWFDCQYDENARLCRLFVGIQEDIVARIAQFRLKKKKNTLK